MLLTTVLAVGQQACDQLFISEMVESNGQNRALELFSPSDSIIDLSAFSIRVFMNGQLTPLIIPLIGNLSPKTAFVIAHPAASNEIKSKADMLHPNMSFDGNDAIVLEKTGGTQVDKIGEVGVDPGQSGWMIPPNGSTKDNDIRRKYSVDKGEPDWNKAKNQWTIHPKDSVSNLKQHQNICGTEVVFSGSGTPLFTSNELIVRFDTSAVNRLAVDNFPIIASTQPVDLSFFIKPFAVSAINQKISGLVDTSVGSITALKIFRQLKTTHTTTISRLGAIIPIPPFWATFVIQFPVGANDLGKVADSLNTLFPLVKYTHPNIIFTNTATADDTRYPDQASLHPTTSYDSAHINIEPAWEFETGKPFVKVGVYDTGIFWEHEDFGDGTASGSKVIGGWDFKDNVPLKSANMDFSSHGTSCAGIIGAIRNNSLGIAGIAGGNDVGLTDLSDKGVSLYGYRITQFFGNPLNYIADAFITSSIEDDSMDYADGIHIMSNSWRFDENFTAYFTDTNITLLTEAVHFANRANVTFVASRGNSPLFTQTYPAIIDDDWVLCVSGTGTDGEYIHIFGSNPNGDFDATRGWEIDVAAPADSTIVKTTTSGNGSGGYIGFAGTSAATPHVAGVVGLLMSYLNTPVPSYNNLAPEDSEAILQMTAKDNNISTYNLPGVDSLSGYGLVDAGAALQMVDKDSRKLSHYDSDSFPSNKELSLISTNDTIVILGPERYQNAAGDWFLPGKYIMTTYKITTTVFHNLSVTDSIVAYWPRPSSSNLLPFYDSNNVLLPRERIKIDSLNQSTAFLTGHVYSVKDTLGNPLGWWPFDTILSQAKFAYTILRHDTAFKDTTVSISNKKMVKGIWATIHPNPAGNLQTLTVYTEKVQYLNIRLYDNTGKFLMKVFEGKCIAGSHTFPVHVDNLANGIYFYVIHGNEGSEHMSIIKHN